MFLHIEEILFDVILLVFQILVISIGKYIVALIPLYLQLFLCTWIFFNGCTKIARPKSESSALFKKCHAVQVL